MTSTIMLIALLVVNKWVVARTGKVTSVLFLPMLLTSFEYFTSYGNVFGTFNSSAYSQLEIGPVAALASMFGIWGIVFIQYLAASLLAYVFKSGTDARQNKRIIISALTLIIVLVGLGAVINSERDQSLTIKVAGITPDRILWDETIETLFEKWETTGLHDQRSGDASFTEQIQRLNEGMINRTKQELESGSRLIGWSEGAAIVMEHEEDGFLQRLQSLSETYEAVLVAGYVRVNEQAGSKMDNHLVIIDADGTIKSRYSKFSLVPGEERYFNKGLEKVPVVDTAAGRIAAAICFDADFPDRVREAGLENPDILVLPSSDWKGITPYHTEMSAFRAIENRMSVLRVTHAGMSAVFDSQGSLVAGISDWESEHGSILSTELPLPLPERQDTVYKMIGDVLPLLFGIVVIIILVIAVYRAIGSRLRRVRTLS
ncbi:nitrilase-related carbon-nitrogen hydrolase [Paenibacillus tarimensis]|uniref:nitrilase-related carbon-nitrogen hydrolase n=1 Tax=Paenibacillus tarimensis TaxID=416012 RepID=UPI0039EE24CC|nr:hypothetical protein [Paenibacillus tarimensis]